MQKSIKRLLCCALTALLLACQSAIGFNLFTNAPKAQSGLWNAMASRFRLLPDSYPFILQRDIRSFSRNPYYINELINNAGPYIYYIYQQTYKRHMPSEIALIPMIESAYDPFEYSSAGATGLWQMMPGTASGFGLTINWWYDGRRDIVASTKAALDYLSYLHNFFNNNWLLAIAAYDAGEGTVQAAIRHNRRLGKPTDYWSLSLPRETENYVPKILALAAIIANPTHYGLTLPSIPNHPYFAIIPMNSQIDLNQAAKLAGVDKGVIRELNPGFRRWATLPDEPYDFLLPIDKAQGFVDALSQIPPTDRVTWRHHKVISSETLSGIANHYHTRVAILKQVNDLRSSRIHIGQSLLVPLTVNGNFNHIDINLQHGAIAEDDLPGPRHVIHTVIPVDNLWTIAAHFGVTVSELRYWNKLGYREKLHVGEKLNIWLPPKTSPAIRYDNYVVKSGDSLSMIAHRYHTKVSMIRHANKMRNNRIRIGQTLSIPIKTRVPYHHYSHKYKHEMSMVTVKPGDTLSGIAARYGLSSRDIIRANKNLAHNSPIKPGEKLRVYH
jgi:membrane-bound lytic murein transglycosylase D